MKIQCPSCDQRLEIPEELAGQTIECPACNKSLDVPAMAVMPPAPIQQSTPQVAASEQPKSSVLKWAAPVAIIAIVAVGVIMFSPNDPNDVSSSEPTAVKNDGSLRCLLLNLKQYQIQNLQNQNHPQPKRQTCQFRLRHNLDTSKLLNNT